MKKCKNRRIAALKALNGLVDIEISGLSDKRRQADERLRVINEDLAEIDSDITNAEYCAQSALDPGARLIIEEYQMLRSYLDMKKRLKVNKQRQQGFAQTRLDSVEKELVTQYQKNRGLQNLLDRKVDDQRLDTEKKQMLIHDEEWLLRKREEV